MAITSASATLQFNVGSFDYQTGLDLPLTSYEDKIVPKFNGLVSEQTPAGDDRFDPTNGDDGTISVLFKVSFAGSTIYQNGQFGLNFSQVGSAPTNPDAVIAVTNFSTEPSETVTINELVSIIKNSSGLPAIGLYVVELQYVWPINVGEDFAGQTASYTINFTPPSVKPSVSYWYDTQVPILTIEDVSIYTLSGVTPTTETEFRVFPPMSGVPQTTSGLSKSVTYKSFWVGQNELKYTVLLTYDFGTYEVVIAHQAYEAVVVVNTDIKGVYECLKMLYEEWKGCPCGTKRYAIIEEKIKEATVLAQLISSGAGCGLDTLSKMVERFNKITGCDCAKPTLKPRFITASLIAEKSEVQNITANTTTTVINLSLGNKIYVEIESFTEIVVTNISANEKYTFIFTSANGSTASFSSVFVWSGGFQIVANPSDNPFGFATYYFEESEGELISMTSLGLPEPLSDGAKNTLREEDGELFWEPVGTGDFLSAGDDVSLLVNDAEYITINDIPPVPAVFERASFEDLSTTFSYNIAQTNANVLDLSTSSSSFNVSVFNRANIQLGRPYIFVINNKGSSALQVSFAGGDFFESSGSLVSSVIPAGRRRSFTFVGSQPDGFSFKTMVLLSKDENYIKQGDNISLLENNANYLAPGSNISLLNNNLGFINEPFAYSEIGSVTGALSVDFENDGEYQKFDATGNLEVSVTGTLNEGKKYGLIFKNTSADSKVIELTSPVFINTPNVIIPAGITQFVFVEFMAISFGGNIALIPTGQNIRPNVSGFSPSPEEITVDQTTLDGSIATIREFSLTGSVTSFNIVIENAVTLTEYTLIFKNDSGSSKDITFNPLSGPITPVSMVEIYGPDGADPSFTVEADSYIVISIKITTDRMIGVVLYPSAEVDSTPSTPTYQALGAVSTNQTVDFDEGENASILVSNADIEVDATNFVEGGIYKLLIYNTGVSSSDVTISTNSFILTPNTITLASNESIGFTLMAVDFGLAGVFLIPLK